MLYSVHNTSKTHVLLDLLLTLLPENINKYEKTTKRQLKKPLYTYLYTLKYY